MARSYRWCAEQGKDARVAYGEPPRSFERLRQMVQEAFRIDVVTNYRLPAAVRGVAIPRPKPDGQRGLIVLGPTVAHRRWVLAHELGHFQTGIAQSELYVDRYPRQSVIAERRANDWAACWLLTVDEILSFGEANCDVSEMGLRDDVPPHALFLRVELAHLLREFDYDRYMRIHSALAALRL